MKVRYWLAMAAVVLTTEVGLAGGLKLGMPGYGGTGCPAGSASISLSPDETELSILFDQFTVEAGKTTGRAIDRKSCNLSIPVTVPQGYSVSIFSIDYRGFNAVPAGGMTRLDTEYFWAGLRGPRYSKAFVGPQNTNFFESNGILASAIVWSRCGDSVNLRVNTSAMAQTNRYQEQTMMAVDSADISAGLIYHIAWRRCN